MDAASTLKMYQEQLAHVSLLPPSEDLELLKENLREAISLLSETVKEEEKAKADKIWMELAEPKEQEDVVSSNEAWDKKKPRPEKESSEASRRAKEQLLSKHFASGGKLDPEDLRREMIVQRNPVRMYKHDDGEERISDAERKRRKQELLEERKKELLSRQAEEVTCSIWLTCREDWEDWTLKLGMGERGASRWQKTAAGTTCQSTAAAQQGSSPQSHRKQGEANKVRPCWTPALLLTVAKAFGAWESGTRGVASRIMRRMGYVHGSGLGKEGEGIMNPVFAKWKTNRTGVGVSDDKMEQVTEEEEGSGKRRRGGRKKWTSEAQRLRAEGPPRSPLGGLTGGAGELQDEQGWNSGTPEASQVLSSGAMVAYGKAMGRAKVDGIKGKDLATAMLHTREAMQLAQQQLSQLDAALARNQANEGMKREIERKKTWVLQHMDELRTDEQAIAKRQDKAGGKSLKGKHLF
ncbi:hypothetical protein GUITHDRAFT_146590 [Guillardia theta CCMP2712]|uniref:G-patch domain-containing protein n=1 Tax=Guillardia theta (strain CCMP2712) TaxID=905079 RepID=L1IGU7_GUITC|nr:hypothetical protein GUITHDRAFT_146590 [Guillardia theta CCMP2712]EKX35282.1 hypothetical protein GUITHDRAFT_146590 [Guillardia theta CCMP2712]|eukprot:XP_005822262.1 hypothetical protein GUITHDRAFT_146590 [Guillardia theta CCMP2712]